MTEAEIIAELTWNVLPSEILGEAIKAVKKLVAERDDALASESHAAKLHSNVSTELLQKEQQLAEARAEIARLTREVDWVIDERDEARRELEQSRDRAAKEGKHE